MVFKFFTVIALLISFKVSFARCTDFVPNEYIVVTSNPQGILDKISNTLQKVSSTDFYLYNHLRPTVSMKATKDMKNLKQSTLVLNLSPQQATEIENLRNTFVYPNCYVTPFELAEETVSGSKIVDEPKYENQWGLNYFLKDINFQTLKFSKKVLIAVSDTGFDTDHDDLKNNLWTNSSEQAGKPGVDDDANGCIDDVHGCDTTLLTGDVGVNKYKSNLTDHGTHVAGIVGAEIGNKLGVSGAAFNSEIMLVRSFSNQKKTTTANLLKSVYYAVDNKADIINCSWGTGSSPTLAEFNAFEYARINNVIAVVAAGNNSTFASKSSPAGLSNVVTVGSFNSSLQLSTFSNFGNAVDILAPGGDGIERKNDSIFSLIPYSRYTNKKGTSMSAPFITAAFANLMSIYPGLNRNELINILLGSANKANVEGFFDSNYKESLNFINFSGALQLADNYSKGFITEDLSYEPKVLRKPVRSGFQTTSSNSNLGAEIQSSGCNSFELNNRAKPSSSWLLLFIPVFLILIKKRTLK